jgi:anion-transporting  ArsA/GET3 family ATPase
MLDRDLVFVTGKGGTGKTTVANTLGLAARAAGGRALVCDVLGVDPRAALTEWMRDQPGGAVAAAVLGRSTAFAHFVDAAPGAKELVTIGKVVDLAREAEHDAVIADGPSTGHALGMLAAPSTVAEIARVGPIGAQARELHAFLRDPARTGYVGVALPEEMALHELLELDAGLHEAVGRGLDLIVVNGVYPDRFTDEEAVRLRGLDACGPVRAALVEHRHGREHAERVAWLRQRVTSPVVTFPFVFTELGPDELRRLAGRLSRSPESGARPQARRASVASAT